MNSANDEVSLDGLHGRRRQARDHRVARSERARARPTVTYKLRDWLFSRQRYWGEPFPIVYDDARPGRAARRRCCRSCCPRSIDFEPVTSDDPDALPRTAARARGRLGRGRARSRRARRGPGYGDGPHAYLARDEHDAAVGGFVLVLPALPRPDQRRRDGRPRGRARVGARARAPTARRRPGSSTSTSAASSTRCCTCCTRASGTRCCSTSATCRRSSRSSGCSTRATSSPPRTPTSAACTSRRPRSTSATACYFHDGEPVTREFGKMGKSLKNAVTPDDIYREYGADTLRLYEMFMGPLDKARPVEHRRHHRRAPLPAAAVAQRRRRGDGRGARRPTRRADDETRRMLHRTIAAVRADMATLSFNTAIARLFELNNHLTQWSHATARAARGRGAAGADGRAARAAHRRGAVGAARPHRDAHVRGRSRPPIPRCSSTTRSRSRCRSTARCARGSTVAGRRRRRRRTKRRPRRRARSPSCSTGKTVRKVIVVPGRIVNFVVSLADVDRVRVADRRRRLGRAHFLGHCPAASVRVLVGRVTSPALPPLFAARPEEGMADPIDVPRPVAAGPSDFSERSRLRGDRARSARRVLACVAIAAGVAWLRAGIAPSAPQAGARRASATPTTATTSSSPRSRPRRAPRRSSSTSSARCAPPGVVRLPAGARVVDAIDAAGGATPSADLARLNLAAQLADGTRIAVPAIGRPPPALDPGAVSGAADPRPADRRRRRRRRAAQPQHRDRRAARGAARHRPDDSPPRSCSDRERNGAVPHRRRPRPRARHRRRPSSRSSATS